MSDLGTSNHWNEACEEVGHQTFQRKVKAVNVHGVDQSQAALKETQNNVLLFHSVELISV